MPGGVHEVCMGNGVGADQADWEHWVAHHHSHHRGHAGCHDDLAVL